METILVFWIIFCGPATLFFFCTKWHHVKSEVIKPLFFITQYVFPVACINTNIWKTHFNEAEQITKLDFYFHPQNTKSFVLSASRTARSDSLNLKLTPNSETLSVLVQIWERLSIVLFLFCNIVFKVQGFKNTLLRAIVSKRFKSCSFMNKLLMQFMYKGLNKPLEKFCKNPPRHLVLHRNENLLINSLGPAHASFLFIFLAKDIP